MDKKEPAASSVDKATELANRIRHEEFVVAKYVQSTKSFAEIWDEIGFTVGFTRRMSVLMRIQEGQRQKALTEAKRERWDDYRQQMSADESSGSADEAKPKPRRKIDL